MSHTFEINKTLFHLDIQYNYFRADECETFAHGLESNHDLYGLHVEGND